MIYLVEDDSSIRELVIYALNSTGLEAKGFEKPSEFWKAVEEEEPSLVILDVMLPEESGIDVLKKIRSNPAIEKLPVIMETAKTSEYDRINGLESGADDYISKPFVLPNLLARIEAVLRRSNWNKQPVKNDSLPFKSDAPLQTLTAREKEVLTLAAKGANNKDIAEKLVLREVTVKSHLNSIFKKLNVTSRTQAVLLALQMELIKN